MKSKDPRNRPYHAGEQAPIPRVETRMPRRLEGTAQTDFGNRMADLRKAAGYSQRELATELGISQRMVAYYVCVRWPVERELSVGRSDRQAGAHDHRRIDWAPPQGTKRTC